MIKMIRVPQFIEKKPLKAAVYKKSPQNKLNLLKISKTGSKCIPLSVFKMFAESTKAGYIRPHWTPESEADFLCLNN